MTKFETQFQIEKNISIEICCIECEEIFSTVLDLNYSDGKFPISNDDVLYCHNCSKSYNYTIKIDSEIVEILFESNNIYGSFKIEGDEFLEEEELEINIIPLDSKRFYFFQIGNLKKLMELDINDKLLKQSLNRLIFSGVITSLETYLNEVLLYMVFYSDYTFEKFVNNYEPYKKEQFSLSEIISKHNDLKTRTRHEINSIVYHNIPRLIKLFNIYNIELNNFSNIKTIARSIQKRHDFVHRSGLDKELNFQIVTESEINLLIDEINLFVSYINSKIDNSCFLQDDIFLVL